MTIELAPLEPIQSIQCQKMDELIDLALEQRADLMAKQARLQVSLANREVAKAAYGPKVFLTGRGGANTEFHSREDAGQYQISLNFEMPLFNGFETTYNNRIAYADSKILMEELAELQLDISLEVLTYSRSLEAAQEMLPDAEENLKNSIKLMKAF